MNTLIVSYGTGPMAELGDWLLWALPNSTHVNLSNLPKPVVDNDVDMIVNLADLDVLDDAERGKKIAVSVLASLPTNLSLKARMLGIPFLHVSNTWVFGGPLPARSDTPLRPLQNYGLLRQWGEMGVVRVNPEANIIRVGSIYGRTGDPWKALNAMTIGATLPLLERPTHSPSFIPDVAVALKVLCDHPGRGEVVHMGPEEEPISWYDFCEPFAKVRPVTLQGMRSGGIQFPETLALRPDIRLPGYDSQRAQLLAWHEGDSDATSPEAVSALGS